MGLRISWFLTACIAIGFFGTMLQFANSQVVPPASAKPEAAKSYEVPLPALADPAYAGIAQPIGFTPVKGSALPVRGANETEFSQTSKKVPMEVYRDEDFQTLVYLSESGAVAAVPYRKNFEIRTHSNASAFAMIRFSPATGVGWQMVSLKWQPIAETGPLPIGDYDVQFMPTADGFTVLRIDRFSGQVWFLDPQDRWQLTSEAEAPVLPSTGTAPPPSTNPSTPAPPRPTPPRPPVPTGTP